MLVYLRDGQTREKESRKKAKKKEINSEKKRIKEELRKKS